MWSSLLRWRIRKGQRQRDKGSSPNWPVCWRREQAPSETLAFALVVSVCDCGFIVARSETVFQFLACMGALRVAETDLPQTSEWSGVSVH